MGRRGMDIIWNNIFIKLVIIKQVFIFCCANLQAVITNFLFFCITNYLLDQKDGMT